MATSLRQVKTRPATCCEIRDMFGGCENDDLVMNIRHIGASPEEILQAFEWLDNDGYAGASFRRRMDNNLCRIYDLVQYERNKFTEER